MITMNDMTIGQRAKIVGYNEEESIYCARLLALGLTRGEIITLKKIAPLGDPVEIEIRGFNLILRKAEASSLSLALV